MARDLNSAVYTYITHFKTTVSRLETYELNPSDRVLKKNILVSVLDAISRTTSNYGDGNKERFTGIIAQFADWSDHSRISAPHIGYFLNHLRSPAFTPARAFIAQIIQQNSNGQFVLLSKDPELDEIRKLWPVPIEQKLVGQLSLSSFSHLNLLYQHRNSLVHELREPGRGMEFHENHEEPFYHGLTTVGASGRVETETLELVYPLKFYFKLTNNVLTNVENYLLSNNIDPYNSYRFGSSWIAELNA